MEPGGWVDAVERIGIGNSVALILALSVGTALIARGPGIIMAGNEWLKTILTHQREKKRVPRKVGRRQAELKTDLQRRISKARVKGTGQR